MLGLFCLWQCNFGQMGREDLGIQDKVDTCSSAYNDGYAIGKEAAINAAGGGVLKLARGASALGRVGRAGTSARALGEAAEAGGRGEVSGAGRALAKHGARPGSAFPAARGSASAINAQAREIVEDIVRNQTRRVTHTSGASGKLSTSLTRRDAVYASRRREVHRLPRAETMMGAPDDFYVPIRPSRISKIWWATSCIATIT